MSLLTKSAYKKGLESPALLWLYVNDRERIPDHDLTTKDVFRQGKQVESYAHELFGDAADLSGLEFQDNVKKTSLMLDSNKSVFEAGVKSGRLYARCDVLEAENGVWNLYEIKMGTSVKDRYLDDLSFQKEVLEREGVALNKIGLVLLDREYERDGSIDPEELFHVEDVTEAVGEAQQGINSRLDRMFRIIRQPDCPDFDPSNIPDSSHGNHLIDEFEASLSDESVYHFYYGGSKIYDLLEEGVERMQDVDRELTRKQEIQKRCAESGDAYVESDEIQAFLDRLEEPLIYLDFEAFNDAIPPFDGLSPYDQVPFQYSMHVEDEDVRHKEFLYRGEDDPRRSFLDSLKNDMPDQGSVIVWHEYFEKKRLREVGEAFGEEEFVSDVITRVVDLEDVFTNFWFYHPRQRGSTSLKQVYPVFAESDGYERLDIDDGEVAAVRFKHNRGDLSDELVDDLLRYCELDTYSMKVIKDGLQNYID